MAAFSGPRVIQQDIRLNIDLANPKIVSGSKKDLAGNISLSELNGVSVTADNLGEWVFDGIDDVVDLGTPASLNLLDEETTVAWVHPYNIDSGRRSRIGNRHGGFLTMTDSRFAYEGSNGSGWTNNLYSGSNTLKLDVWQQLAFTFKRDDRVDLYYNGTYITGKVVTDGIDNSTVKFVIGSENPGGWGTPTYFIGKIGVVQVYARKLTADEIKQNFEATRSRYGI